LKDKPLSLIQCSMAGMFAGVVNCVVCTPVELLKTQLQVQIGFGTDLQFKGQFDCARQIFQTHGFRGFYRGNFATIIREIPGYGGQFFVYEGLKNYLTKGNEAPSLTTLITAGGCAGIGGWVVSYPMDFVKSKIQSEPLIDPLRPRVAPPRAVKTFGDGGFISYWRDTVRNEGGFRALWRGFGTCVGRAFPANAASFLAYETTLKYLRNLDATDED
jgi:solute carrier family 25 carnitine/acylcarnitine transporter 20/29